MHTITRTNMSPFIAGAKVLQVAGLVRKAGARSVQARNDAIIATALHQAHAGRSQKAFQGLSHCVVPAGTVKPCCALHSARSGCSTHGYPRFA